MNKGGKNSICDCSDCIPLFKSLFCAFLPHEKAPSWSLIFLIPSNKDPREAGHTVRFRSRVCAMTPSSLGCSRTLSLKSRAASLELATKELLFIACTCHVTFSNLGKPTRCSTEASRKCESLEKSTYQKGRRGGETECVFVNKLSVSATKAGVH